MSFLFGVFTDYTPGLLDSREHMDLEEKPRVHRLERAS